MIEKLKGLTRDSLYYGIGHIATRVLTFLLLPYYSHRLTPAEYGELTLYFIFVAVVQTFFLYGMDIAYLRYYNLSRDPAERARITGTTVVASLITSTGFSLLIILAASTLGGWLVREPANPEDVRTFITLCSGILFFDTLSTFPFLLLRAKRRVAYFVVIKLANVVVNLVLNIWFIGTLGWTIYGVLLANLVASALTALIMIPDVVRDWRVTIDRRLLAEMVRFGLPNIPTYLFVMVIELASRKVVEWYDGLEEAGLFSAGYKLGMFMSVVTAAFRFAWQPFFLAHADDSDAPRLFARVLTYYILVTCSLFLVLTFFVIPIVTSDLPLIGTVIDQRYWAGLSVFPIILLAHIFDGIYANMMVGVYIKKLTSRLPWVTGIAAAFNVLVNLWLVPIYGFIAAAWITLGSFVIEAIMIYWITHREYPVPYEWARVAKIFAVTGAVVLAGLFQPLSSLWARGALILAFPVLLWFSGFPDVREKLHLKRLISAA